MVVAVSISGRKQRMKRYHCLVISRREMSSPVWIIDYYAKTTTTTTTAAAAAAANEQQQQMMMGRGSTLHLLAIREFDSISTTSSRFY